jgi:hypothetical protein
MSILRFWTVVGIFAAVSVAWATLGGTMWQRTEALDRELSGEMLSLWGPEVLVQVCPYWAPNADGRPADPGSITPDSSTITADIEHEHRYKGLLWYSTFTVKFDAKYTFEAQSAAADAGEGTFLFRLPPGVNGYEDLEVSVDDTPRAIPPDQLAAGRIRVPMSLKQPAAVRVRYTTRAQDTWLYLPNPHSTSPTGSAALTTLSNFSLTVRTNFAEIDYPSGSRSPSKKAHPAGGGMTATWDLGTAHTNQAMGVAMPTRPNAGPIAARMSLFAPVSLFFFFTTLFTLVVLKKIPLHPMHYLFIAAGFFAFHILLAYLADKISIHVAFWICASVSVFLVISYMRLVAGVAFAVIYVGAAQLVYLLGFSYAFFFPGWTGLTIVVGAVMTLFVLMQATGRVNWFDAFKKPIPNAAVAESQVPRQGGEPPVFGAHPPPPSVPDHEPHERPPK